MPDTDGVITGEGRFSVAHWAVDGQAVDRIDPIENKEPEIAFCGGFEAIAERGDVCVETAADILDVEDQRIELLELFRKRAARFTVETVNRQPCSCVPAVAH